MYDAITPRGSVIERASGHTCSVGRERRDARVEGVRGIAHLERVLSERIAAVSGPSDSGEKRGRRGCRMSASYEGKGPMETNVDYGFAMGRHLDLRGH